MISYVLQSVSRYSDQGYLLYFRGMRSVLLVLVWLRGLRQLFKGVIRIAYVFNGKCKAMYSLVILITKKINKKEVVKSIVKK